MPGKVSLGMRRLSDEQNPKIKSNGEDFDYLTREEIKEKIEKQKNIDIENTINEKQDELKKLKAKLVEIDSGEQKENMGHLTDKIRSKKNEMINLIKDKLDLDFYVKEFTTEEGEKVEKIFLYDEEDQQFEMFEGDDAELEAVITKLYKELYELDDEVEKEISFDLAESDKEVSDDLAGLQKEVENNEAQSASDLEGVGLVQKAIDFVRTFDAKSATGMEKGILEAMKVGVGIFQAMGGSFLASLFDFGTTGQKINELATALGLDQEKTKNGLNVLTGTLPEDYTTKNEQYLKDRGIAESSILDKNVDDKLTGGTPTIETIIATFGPTTKSIANKLNVPYELILTKIAIGLTNNKERTLRTRIPGVGKISGNNWKGETVKIDGESYPTLPDRNLGLIHVAQSLTTSGNTTYEKMISLVDSNKNSEKEMIVKLATQLGVNDQGRTVKTK